MDKKIKAISENFVVNHLQVLYNEIANHEDWLINQIIDYVKYYGYINHSPTLVETWRASICRLSESLLTTIKNHPQIIDLDPYANYQEDPIAVLGIREAQRHRSKGVSFSLFLGLMKYYRQAYQDLISQGNFTKDQQDYFRLYVNRFFDKVELGFCGDLLKIYETEKTEKLLDQAIDINHYVNEYLTNIAKYKRQQQETEKAKEINPETQAIFNVFPDLFVRIDKNGKILDYCSQSPSLFSSHSSSWIGKPINEIFLGQAGNQLQKAIQESWKIKGLVCLEYQLNIDESLEFFEARIMPFKRTRSRLLEQETIAIIRNITERKNTEIALKDSENNLRNLINISNSGLVVLDHQGKVLFVNPAAENIFGRKAMDIVGEVLGIPIILGEFTEIEIPHSSGKLMFIQMKVVEINWQGKTAYLASMMDITNLKQAQERLKILQRATEQSPISIVITDAKGKIEYVNPKFEEVTGYTQAEVLGKNPRILKSGEASIQEYKQLWQTITAGQQWHGEFHNRRKNGELFWEAASISPIKNEEGIITHLVAIKEDITERKAREQTLYYQANYDALTGLANRFLAMDRLRQSLMQAQRNQQRVGIMFVDLDHFKDVNDTLGHEYGDLLLKQVSQRLLNTLRKSDTVARLGGDEFLIIITELAEACQCKQIAAKILAALSQPFDLAGEEAFISASIGITLYPDDGDDVSVLMRNADVAMYKGKKNGRNDFQFYAPWLNETTQNRVRMENLLRYALKRKELYPVYQPFVDLKSNRIVGAEALMRWQNKELGRVSPNNFIPIAEETGLINELGVWMLSQVSQEVAIWNKINPALWIAVNLSPRQFREPNFLQIINQMIVNSGIKPHNLELEITEKLLLEDIPEIEKLIFKLHQQGFRFSIDDFGTGYSCLSSLIKFPFKILKIDRSFISDVPNNSEFVGLVKSIIAMGQSLNLKVVAEGIETKEQLEFLKREGCNYGQGYFFSPPLRALEFRKHLQKS